MKFITLALSGQHHKKSGSEHHRVAPAPVRPVVPQTVAAVPVPVTPAPVVPDPIKRPDTTYACPRGFDLSGKHCSKVTVASPSNVCDEGSLVGESMCVTKVPAEKICNSGEKRGDSCYTVQTAEPLVNCPVGFLKSGDKCEMAVPLPLERDCPTGKMVDGACQVGSDVLDIKREAYCPTGSLQRDNQCFSRQNLELEFVCANGMLEEGGQSCKTIETADRITESVCPAGYTPDSAGTICTTSVPLSLDYECSRGAPAGNSCIDIETSAPIVKKKCPAGYRQTDDKCVRNVSLETEKSCLEGQKLDNGLCFSSVEGDFITSEYCPAGFKKNADNICTRKMDLPLVTACAEGRIQVGDVCMSVIEADRVTETSCPAEFEPRGKLCVIPVTLPFAYECPKGERRGDVCVETIHADKEAREWCPLGFKDSIDDKNCERQVPLPTKMICKEGRMENGKCWTTDIIPLEASANCPKGFTENSATSLCEVKIPLPTKMICEDGGELISGMCAKSEFSEAIVTEGCPAGFKDSGKKEGCFKTVQYDCSPQISGKKLRSSVAVVQKTCERKEVTDKNVVVDCKPGSVDSGNGCEEIVFTPAREVCSTGRDLSECHIVKTQDKIVTESCKDSYVKAKGACMDIREIGEPEALCINNKPLDECFTVEYERKQFVENCGEGYLSTRDGCNAEVLSPLVKVCSDKDKPVSDCVTEETAPLIVSTGCDTGYMAVGDKCIVEEYTPTEMQCSDPSLSVAECQVDIFAPLMSDKECPMDFVEDIAFEKCTQTIVTDAIERCSDNNLDLDNCQKEESVEPIVSMSCQNGFSMDDDQCVMPIYFPKVAVCEDPSLTVDNCVTTESAALLTSSGCPAGFYDLSKEKICERPSYEAAELQCVDSLKPVDACFMDFEVSMEYLDTCAFGFSPDNGMCVKKNFVPAKTVCSDDDKSVSECFDIETAQETVSCRDNYMMTRDGNCEIETATPASLMCSVGKRAGNVCVIAGQPPKQVCPATYSLKNRVCSKTEMAEPIVTYTRTCLGKGCDA